MANQYISDETQQTFQRFAFWSKFVAVLGFISAGIMILAGLPLLLLFGLGLIYIGLGIYYIFMLKHLWSAANQAKELADEQDEAKLTEGLLNGFQSLSYYFKMSGILVLISLVIGVLGGVIAVGSIFLAISNGDFDDVTNTSSDSSIIYDNSDLEEALRELENFNNQ